jgi:hypothetical protein
MHRRALFVLALIAALVAPLAATAQDPLEFDDDEYGEWSFAITPYAFLAAQSTDVGGEKLRSSFNDLASITNFGLQARVYARWRWLTFTADGTFATLGQNAEIGPVDADATINQWILDLKLGGLVHDNRTREQDGGWAIWVGAGARYWENDVEVEVTYNPILPGNDPVTDTIQAPQAWWDPVLGVAMHFPVTPVVSFGVRATGGGFGIGDASTYMWDGEFTALFRVAHRLAISAGYRQFKYNRTDGEGEDAVEQTVTVVGPQIGLSIGIF